MSYRTIMARRDQARHAPARAQEALHSGRGRHGIASCFISVLAEAALPVLLAH